VPGGTLDNLEHVSGHVDWSEGLSSVDKAILSDAQTSGGLLIALPADDAERLLERLHERGVTAAAHIGRITGKGRGRIRV